MLLPYKEHVHTITVDNGNEFTDHLTLAKKLYTQIYFTHLYSSWEKGLIENTNKLIRQYIPKKTNFNEFSNNIIKQIQYRINERPRYKLNIYSPKEIFFLDLKQKVAVTS
ncbi:IS30 family transposase [Tannerella forsythia]|uniref:IS30 family transposase n=2 Tax=Tannerella forsythia TaxID=28112 RepID=A0A3P1YV03_TANFO|nr:IS30 family transposase [Tannerella forsythia]